VEVLGGAAVALPHLLILLLVDLVEQVLEHARRQATLQQHRHNKTEGTSR
jgi:hypothetical protein